MAQRWVGEAHVRIMFRGTARNGKEEYIGRVRAGKHAWVFEHLYAPAMGFGCGVAYDSSDAYDAMAASACSFGAYFTTHNRGHDVPEWAPPAEVADAIEHAISQAVNEDGSLDVRRTKRWPAVRGATEEKEPT